MVAYIYALLWLAVGFILLFRMGEENRVFYPIGIFFLILSVWWAAGEYTGVNLFTGGWGWALRAITVAALVLACLEFAKELKKTRSGNKKE